MTTSLTPNVIGTLADPVNIAIMDVPVFIQDHGALPVTSSLTFEPSTNLFHPDGLYSESKISLETLFNRWNSESWGEYLCLAGAVIGYVLFCSPWLQLLIFKLDGPVVPD